jgi:hypothetical protein
MSSEPDIFYRPSDSEYDIFYHDDLYGHMGEVITLFCTKTRRQILDQYIFVDLNPEVKTKNCVNFKKHLDEFVLQNRMVFFRGNAFNGRLYGLLNSYFENGSFNYDAFEFVSPKSNWKFTYDNEMMSLLYLSYWYKPEHSEDKATPTGPILARKDSINNRRLINFTGTIDHDVYDKNMQFGNSLEGLEPGYYINGIKASLYEEVIETAPFPFGLFVRQNVTYAFIGYQLFRNGTPFTGEIPKGSNIFDGSIAGKKYTDGYENK